MAIIKRFVCHCDRCGHEWIPTVPHPTHCAKCKTRQWNENVKQGRK